jgi:phosphate transport system permease protein
MGGLVVVASILLIFFYLVYIVTPLFLPASISTSAIGANPEWGEENTVYLSIEEQQRVAFRIDRRGRAEFFKLDGLENLGTHPLAANELPVADVIADMANNGLVAVAFEDGRVVLLQHGYETDYSAGVAQRRIVPSLEFPYGEQARELMPDGGIKHLALSDGELDLLVAAAGTDGRVRVELSTKQASLFGEEVTLDSEVRTMDVDFEITGIAVSENHRWLYLADDQGRIHFIRLADMQELQSVQVSDSAISSLRMLLGGISVLAGDAGGGITQLFPVRDQDNQYRLEPIRQFKNLPGMITRIIPEQRRKGFIALDDSGRLGIYHSTAGRLILDRRLDSGPPAALALAPRAAGLLVINTDGSADFMDVKNQHPETSFSTLWQKVWYENYEEPGYVWQSSASDNAFEPKFSLTPLAFGTLKAALYAMLFAVPLALAGAAYTAYFMSPGLRRLVKPTIEIMAALPTVILGFLAGLWFAPILEENLAAIFSLLLLLPAGLLVFAWFWTQADWRIKAYVKNGWEPVLLLPVLVVLSWLSIELAGPLQQLFFGGDMRTWLSREAGISYDQRNAMVVGFAMGFAIIPTIFSITEDAVFGVPKTLSEGSLALGATPWQTLVRVVLPTASPGMFSALMIGFGRAVGETMIVLMATGNTPIMEWNLFEGMRTLAANIAVEMPESALNSTHYRILFLAALVLFVFTFLINTGAELIRQRLREKYSSL